MQFLDDRPLLCNGYALLSNRLSDSNTKALTQTTGFLTTILKHIILRHSARDGLTFPGVIEEPAWTEENNKDEKKKDKNKSHYTAIIMCISSTAIQR